MLKANNALPFVPSMTFCEVTATAQRHASSTATSTSAAQRFTERITLEEPHRVVFTRIAGPVLGTIANEIEGPDDDLGLRFSFALVVAGVEGGSAAEQEYAESMTGDYLKAVARDAERDAPDRRRRQRELIQAAVRASPSAIPHGANPSPRAPASRTRTGGNIP